ncbi:MAG TPA: hypothetical protein ACFYEK_11175 [Candidatus Wunengus sp. YC60]|uniref:hypothetical protein n=1 Tax=Candidatus Wunengus sp. YC60 TaxID=3367697 RepID=UPI004027EE7E
MKNWLEKNKIFFETIAAFLLSAMAIIISVVQIFIGFKQTKLAKIQTQIAQRQFQREERLANIERTGKWGELRSAMMKILEQFPSSGTKSIRTWPQEDQLLFFKNVRMILDSQIKNPVLIENRDCLGHWRVALSCTEFREEEVLGTTNMPEIQDVIIVGSANKIHQSIMYVWKRLVLDSNEVSSTGGEPN